MVEYKNPRYTTPRAYINPPNFWPNVLEISLTRTLITSINLQQHRHALIASNWLLDVLLHCHDYIFPILSAMYLYKFSMCVIRNRY